MTVTRSQSIRRVLIYIFAAAGIGVGVYMWADPVGWYNTTPGVPNTGPHNPHFIRDIGAIYLSMSVAMFIGLRQGQYLRPALMFSTIWLSLHAFIHFWDISAGRLPMDHLMADVPGVFLPPLILGYLCFAERDTTY